MTSPQWLTDDEQHAWRSFLLVHARLSSRMNRDLQRSAGLSLADYDVMVNLADAPEGKLRAFELGDALQWEQSRLSHHLARMHRRDLVRREHCPDDGRGAFVVLTDTGRERLVAAAPAHVASVRQLVFDGLDEGSLRALTTLCDDVLARLEDDAAERDVAPLATTART
jgi:DNA-binding MarR family transcriptional regulator